MTYDGYTKYDARVAQSYEDDRRCEDHWQAEQQFMSRYAADHRLGRLLDVPVGTGRFFECYARAESVVGVDVSAHMLQIARRKAAQAALQNVELIEGDVVGLPYPDACFDTVVCFRLMHLLPPHVVKAAFVELARVSAGSVLVQVYAADERSGPARILSRAHALARKLMRRLMSRSQKPWSHINSYGHSEQFLLSAAADAGLRLHRRNFLARYGQASVDVLELAK